jgi:hypothetical protein
MKTFFEYVGAFAYTYGMGFVGILALSLLVFGW